ncbi:MAG: hypothetical protein ACLPKB_21700 [Xanthobacteraceae bacterium]
MTPAFWLLRAGLMAFMQAIIALGGFVARGARRLGRGFRRRRARIVAVTDARLLDDMGISRDVLCEVFREPGARREARTGRPFPPTDRPARHHF